jgi:LmbE family N-acetylglucosaminyl deacetylase
MGEKTLRIIAFGAHPDDCEYVAAGVAARWARAGHAVKFVSVTNGDVGHFAQAGGPLAQRRAGEVRRCAEILGISSQVLDIHDGELMPTLENRKTLVRLIREWNADLVLGHRPNDYHPDHRNVGVLVQDAAYMVTVPFFCPDVPHLTHNPVFLFYEDRFVKPNPFTPDLAVGIDEVIEQKLDCFDALESQFYEGGCNATADLVPKDKGGQAERRRKVRADFRKAFAEKAEKYRSALGAWYGEKAAPAIQFVEAFEICEYGRRPENEELRRLFPFFPRR